MWQTTPKFFVIDDGHVAVYRREIPEKGFLWVVGKRMGYQPTIEKAKEMAEAVLEHMELKAYLAAHGQKPWSDL